MTAGLMLGVYTILESAKWSAVQTVLLGAVSVGLIVAFLVRQTRIANPLMPLRLFRSRQVSGANLIQSLLVVGMFGMFFLGALYLQQILGYSALEVGLAFLPTTIAMGIMSLRVSGPVMMRYGLKAAILPSLLLIGAGLLLFTQTPVHGAYLTDLLPAMILVGLGAGLGFPALMGLAMSGATPSDSGLASGLVNTTVQVGGAIGLAVLSTLADGRTTSQLAAGASHEAALNSGYHLAYLIGAVLVAVAAAVTVFTLRKPRAASPEDVAVPEAEPALVD
jgi:predicted MFS family arabinose efflux permease